MVRLTAPDYLGQERDKSKLPERKEFIYYHRTLGRSGSWKGVPLKSSSRTH